MFGISFDRASSRPVSLQLLESLRKAVHDGRLPEGSALPSSRRFAEELGISRRLAAEVYDQLVSEGYFAARQGSGTRVAEGLARPSAGHAVPFAPEPPPRPVRFDFSPGIPDLTAFPRRAWLRAMDSALSFASLRELSYGPLQGDPGLRAAVAEHLFRHRGIVADPAKILLTTGTSNAFLVLSLLKFTGKFYFEDPGSGFGHGAFSVAGNACEPMRVDDGGADPASFTMERNSLVALNPSHQFPTGSVLTIARRLKFLELARQTDSFILEDDYDSEFRLKGQPVPAMYSLQPERVIYLGSFSKSLAPFLRAGYLLAPEALHGRILDLCRQVNARTSGPTSGALARLMASGQLERHLFRQKRTYQKRQAEILTWLKARSWDVAVGGRDTGSHLYLAFRDRRFDPGFTDRCRARGLRVVVADAFFQDPERGRNALVLGYGNIAGLAQGLDLLGQEIDALRP